jgi:hypothetical protein
MSIVGCPTCGGDHYGSNKCPFIEAPCVVCGKPTILACSDCAIESGGKDAVHVCSDEECRGEHEFWRHKATVRGADDATHRPADVSKVEK